MSKQVANLTIKRDIHDMDKRIKRKLRHIHSELSSENISLIEQYYDAMKLETCGKVVQDKHLQCIYKMTLVLNKYWKDASKIDIDKIVLWIIDKYTDVKGQETHASSDYKKVLKIFFRWIKLGYRKKNPNYPDPIEIRDITVKRVKNRLSREDLITEEDRIKLLHACADNLRDKAFIDTNLDAGDRPGEHMTLQIKHIGQDKNVYFIKVDGKTNARPIRLIKSTPSLAAWVNAHPFKNNPEAPLWPNLSSKNYGDQLTYKGVRNMLKNRAKLAGINKRVYMYLNRHSEITNTANFLTEGQLRKRHGWTSGSKSPEIYTHLTQSDVDDAMLSHYGIKKSKHTEDEDEAPKVCSICEMPNDCRDTVCSKCSKPLDIQTAIDMEEKEEKDSLKKKLEQLEIDSKMKDNDFERRLRVLAKHYTDYSVESLREQYDKVEDSLILQQ